MLRSLLAISLCCAALPAFADAPPTDVPVQLAMFDGPAANSCLHVPDPGEFGFGVLQAQCLTVGNAQMFHFEPAVQGGYRIINGKSQDCLDAGSNPVPGKPVQAVTCNGEDTQRWDVNYSEGNPATAMIRSARSGLCLDFTGGMAAQSSCDFEAGQGPTWMANRQGARVPSGAHALRSAHDGECMSLSGIPTSVACSNDRRSSLRFVPLDVAAATFRFDGVVDGNCLLDITGAVVYESCITGQDGHWRIVEAGIGAPGQNGERAINWQVRNIGTGQCINAGRGSFVPEGETVTAWACDTSTNAQWQFVKY